MSVGHLWPSGGLGVASCSTPPYRRSGDRRVLGAVCGVILDEVIEAGGRAVATVHERSADKFRADLNVRDALLWNVIVIVLGSAHSREECGSPLREEVCLPS